MVFNELFTTGCKTNLLGARTRASNETARCSDSWMKPHELQTESAGHLIGKRYEMTDRTKRNRLQHTSRHFNTLRGNAENVPRHSIPDTAANELWLYFTLKTLHSKRDVREFLFTNEAKAFAPRHSSAWEQLPALRVITLQA